MAANTNPTFVLLSKTAAVQILPADTTTLKTLLTAGANGARVTGVNVVSTDTVAQQVGLYIQLAGAGTDFPLMSKAVPARSGDNSLAANVAAAVNLLDLSLLPSRLSDGSLLLGAGDLLKVASQATVTAAKALTVIGLYGDF